MRTHETSFRRLLAGSTVLPCRPAIAADVTPARLAQSRSRGNWLTNHRTYDAQRYSPLDQHQQGDTSKTLSSPMRSRSAAPRATRSWRRRRSPRTASSTSTNGACSTRSTAAPATWAASCGAWIRGRRSGRCQPRRRAMGQFCHHRAGEFGNPPRIIATDKETGTVAWQTNFSDGQPDVHITAAPLAVKDKIIVGASGGDSGVRDFIVGLDAATGKLLWQKYHHSGAGRAGLGNLEGQEQRLADRRRRHVGHRLLRPGHQPDHLGHRQSGADVEPTTGRATTSTPTALISWDPDTGRMNWYFQYTPGDHLGLRRGRHPHPHRRP